MWFYRGTVLLFTLFWLLDIVYILVLKKEINIYLILRFEIVSGNIHIFVSRSRRPNLFFEIESQGPQDMGCGFQEDNQSASTALPSGFVPAAPLSCESSQSCSEGWALWLMGCAGPVLVCTSCCFDFGRCPCLARAPMLEDRVLPMRPRDRTFNCCADHFALSLFVTIQCLQGTSLSERWKEMPGRGSNFPGF